MKKIWAKVCISHVCKMRIADLIQMFVLLGGGGKVDQNLQDGQD